MPQLSSIFRGPTEENISISHYLDSFDLASHPYIDMTLEIETRVFRASDADRCRIRALTTKPSNHLTDS